MKKIIVKAEVKDVDKLENRLMNLGYDFDPMYFCAKKLRRTQ